MNRRGRRGRRGRGERERFVGEEEKFITLMVGEMLRPLVTI